MIETVLICDGQHLWDPSFLTESSPAGMRAQVKHAKPVCCGEPAAATADFPSRVSAHSLGKVEREKK